MFHAFLAFVKINCRHGYIFNVRTCSFQIAVFLSVSLIATNFWYVVLMFLPFSTTHLSEAAFSVFMAMKLSGVIGWAQTTHETTSDLTVLQTVHWFSITNMHARLIPHIDATKAGYIFTLHRDSCFWIAINCKLISYKFSYRSQFLNARL